MERAPAPTTRETVTEGLATIAHLFYSYPRSVEAIGTLVIEHLQDAAASGYPETAAATPDEAMAGFERVFDAVMRDPRLREIVTHLRAEYLPPPYTQLPPVPGEPATEGEPLILTGAALAIGIGIIVAGELGAF